MSTRLVRKPTVVVAVAVVDAGEVVLTVVVVDVATNNQYRKTAILAVFSRAGSPCHRRGVEEVIPNLYS